MKYDFRYIEKRWQKRWLDEKTFKAKENSGKPKYYQLETFPYPSAAGLHVGHPKGYIAEDIHARYMRMRGYEVLYTMGWDAFGLPTENYAIKVGKSPKEVAESNIKNFKRQLQMFGFSYDWDREINTSSPEYYKWTQWLFIQLFKKGLAYRAKAKVNWCPKDQTVLANEQVVDGKCDRCGAIIEQREMEQWFFKITDYAERLLEDLKSGSCRIDWPAATIKRQEDWIGKSEGALLKFLIPNSQFEIEVFTTRPDTLFGATYMVLAPEHPLIENFKLKIENLDEVQKYVEATKHKTELMRQEEAKDKTGVELKGIKAINPATKEEIPIWVADYVLMGYGTGAIMAVPAHDERDFEFAVKFDLPAKQVVLKRNAPIKSYLMGAENITEKDLMALGIKIVEKTEDGNFKIEIPEKSLTDYETFIEDKMAPGFWNEYIGKEIVFIFKFKDGKIERIVLNDETESRVDRLAAEFNVQSRTKSSVWRWLTENSWYKDLILHTESGVLINSGKFSGLDSETAKWEITEFVGGKKKVQYKIRDWSVSRQRYWGAPIPVIYCSRCPGISNFQFPISKTILDGVEYAIHPVPEKDLPVLLPELANYRPKGIPPLASSEKFVKVKCPMCGGDAKRDPETLDTFVDSSWYYLAYAMQGISNFQFPISNYTKAISHWLPVDLYIIGAEHTVLHLLYSRFITKFLHDEGYLNFTEPFLKLRHQGLILGEDGQKMSKSKGNVVNPDELIEEFGADTVRLYEMFMGPFEDGAPWDPKGVLGVERFLKRAWNLMQNAKIPPEAKLAKGGKNQNDNAKSKNETSGIDRLLHKTIKKVGEDIENLKFNTAISALMILLNEMSAEGGSASGGEKQSSLPFALCQNFVKILHPFAPHLTQELWVSFGNKTILDFEPWPAFDSALIEDKTFTIVIQVNGKVRDSVEASVTISESEAKELALEREKIKNVIGSKSPKKVIYVPKKLVSILI